jgi:hypothetical protein
MEQKPQRKSAYKEIKFRCKVCECEGRLEDMKPVNRFFPPLILCRYCEKKLR